MEAAVMDDRDARERRESVKFGRAFLLGAALSCPAWAVIWGFVAMVHAVAR